MNIISNMAQINDGDSHLVNGVITVGKDKYSMDEKVYKTMNNTGAWSIAVGVVSLVVGLASGVIMIVNGARLLSSKSKIIF